MGMFDYITCEYPLSFEEVEKSMENPPVWSKMEFQTKSFSENLGGFLENYTIEEDGQLYLDNEDWDGNSNVYGNGTQVWKVNDRNVEYDRSESSIDIQLRSGRYSNKPESLKEEEADRVEMGNPIKFVPNRLVGFVRTDWSYHSIHPMVLPEGITRDCFQINIWKVNERY